MRSPAVAGGVVLACWTLSTCIVTRLGLHRPLDTLRVAVRLMEVDQAGRPLAEALALIPTEEIQDTKTVAALQATALLLGAGLPAEWAGGGASASIPGEPT